jgi:chromosome segregation ATPase
VASIPLSTLEHLADLPVARWGTVVVAGAGDGVRWRVARGRIAVDRWILVEADRRRGAFLSARTRGLSAVTTLRPSVAGEAAGDPDPSAGLNGLLNGSGLATAPRTQPNVLVLQGRDRDLAFAAGLDARVLAAFDWILVDAPAALRDEAVRPLAPSLRAAGFSRLNVGAGAPQSACVEMLCRDADKQALWATGESLRGQRDALASERDELGERLGEMQERAETWRLRAESLNTQLGELRREMQESAEAWRLRVATLDAQLDAARVEEAAARERESVTRERESAARASEAAAIEREAEACRRETEALQREAVARDREVAAGEREAVAVQGALSAREAAQGAREVARTTRESLAAADERNALLKAENARWRSHGEEWRAEREDMRQRLDAAAEQHEVTRARAEGLRAQVEALRGQVEASRGQEAATRGEVRVLRDALAAATAQVADLDSRMLGEATAHDQFQRALDVHVDRAEAKMALLARLVLERQG